METRKILGVLFLVVVLCFPAYSFAEMMKAEGTIQGLMSTCEAKMCTPGEETIIAAMEETFVLVTKPGEYYLLPNLKGSMLARYLGRTVRVEGQPKLDGRAIVVRKAEVLVDDTWHPFYSPEILQMRQAREEGYMAY